MAQVPANSCNTAGSWWDGAAEWWAILINNVDNDLNRVWFVFPLSKKKKKGQKQQLMDFLEPNIASYSSMFIHLFLIDSLFSSSPPSDWWKPFIFLHLRPESSPMSGRLLQGFTFGGMLMGDFHNSAGSPHQPHHWSACDAVCLALFPWDWSGLYFVLLTIAGCSWGNQITVIFGL